MATNTRHIGDEDEIRTHAGKPQWISKGHLEDRLYTFLARYRVTPQGTTGRAPAEFLLKTPPQTRLDLLRPSVQDTVLRRQAYDKQRHDTRSVIRTFRVGDSVWALNFQGKPKWIPTMVENQLGPLTFTVRLRDGRTVNVSIGQRELFHK